jgi:hypothetical protein
MWDVNVLYTSLRGHEWKWAWWQGAPRCVSRLVRWQIGLLAHQMRRHAWGQVKRVFPAGAGEGGKKSPSSPPPTHSSRDRHEKVDMSRWAIWQAVSPTFPPRATQRWNLQTTCRNFSQFQSPWNRQLLFPDPRNLHYFMRGISSFVKSLLHQGLGIFYSS